MPRKPRLHVPGGFYHVVLRGNGRRDIFGDDDDRSRWESLIEAQLRRYKHRIHAYCWMTNHVHLAIQASEVPLSAFMRNVACQYSRSTNAKYNKSGHLFERRHRAILVQDDAYLMEVIRYIHLNPVRAGITRSPEQYRWSSHRAYLCGSCPGWLTLEWVLGIFGNTVGNARQQFVQFMRSDIQESMLQRLRRGNELDRRILGDGGFNASLGAAMISPPQRSSLEDLVQEVCRQHQVPPSALETSSRQRLYTRVRAEIGLAAIELGIATNADVARRFNRCQSGLSRSIERLRQERNNSNK